MNLPCVRFKTRLSEFQSIPRTEWKPEQILAYIMQRYEQTFNVEYSLSLSGPPSKCQEIYCIKRMQSILNSEDPAISIAYVDWVFDTIIIPKKMELKSLAFFFTTNVVRDFKAKYKKSKKILRSTQLPSVFGSVINSFGYDFLQTYGDLAFVKLSIESNPDNNEYQPLFHSLQENGFDPLVLEDLE